MNNRVVVKRDPPEHGFGLWPGSGKVAGKVLILDLGKGPAKILILLDSVPVWLRARAADLPTNLILLSKRGPGSLGRGA